MNQEPPSQPPSELPPTALPPAPPPGPAKPPLPFWGMFGLGIALLVASCLLCALFQNPSPVGWSALAAFIMLFIRGYRGIFLGYLAGIGVALLVAAIICGIMGAPRID